jgi:hypothetical protein
MDEARAGAEAAASAAAGPRKAMRSLSRRQHVGRISSHSSSLMVLSSAMASARETSTVGENLEGIDEGISRWAGLAAGCATLLLPPPEPPLFPWFFVLAIPLAQDFLPLGW